MLIRVGFEASFEFATPAAVVLMPYVHPSRTASMRQFEGLSVVPNADVRDFGDSYGNLCARTTVPTGAVTFRTSAIVEDNGQLDPQYWNAYQHPIPELPDDVLLFLLPSRYCEVDSELRDIAWSLFGKLPAGWPLVQEVCNFVHSHIRFDYMHGPRQSDGARSVSRASRRVPRLHAFGDYVLPLPQCAGSLLHGLFGRHRRAAARLPDGFQRVV